MRTPRFSTTLNCKSVFNIKLFIERALLNYQTTPKHILFHNFEVKVVIVIYVENLKYHSFYNEFDFSQQTEIRFRFKTESAGSRGGWHLAGSRCTQNVFTLFRYTPAAAVRRSFSKQIEKTFSRSFFFFFVSRDSSRAVRGLFSTGTRPAHIFSLGRIIRTPSGPTDPNNCSRAWRRLTADTARRTCTRDDVSNASRLSACDLSANYIARELWYYLCERSSIFFPFCFLK